MFERKLPTGLLGYRNVILRFIIKTMSSVFVLISGYRVPKTLGIS